MYRIKSNDLGIHIGTKIVEGEVVNLPINFNGENNPDSYSRNEIGNAFSPRENGYGRTIKQIYNASADIRLPRVVPIESRIDFIGDYVKDHDSSVDERLNSQSITTEDVMEGKDAVHLIGGIDISHLDNSMVSEEELAKY